MTNLVQQINSSFISKDTQNSIKQIGQFDSLIGRVSDLPECIKNAAGPNKENYTLDIRGQSNAENEIKNPNERKLSNQKEKILQTLMKNTADTLEDTVSDSNSSEDEESINPGLIGILSNYLTPEEIENLSKIKSKERTEWLSHRIVPKISEETMTEVPHKVPFLESEINIIAQYFKESELQSITVKRIEKAQPVGQIQHVHFLLEIKDNRSNEVKSIWRTYEQLNLVFSMPPIPSNAHTNIQELMNNFFIESLKNPSISKDPQIQASLTHLPSDKTKTLLKLKISKISDLYFEKNQAVDGVFFRSCLVDEKQNRISSWFKSVASDEKGIWEEQTITYDLNNDAIFGIVVIFERDQTSFGTGFFPITVIRENQMSHTMPIWRYYGFKKYFHGIFSFSTELLVDSQVPITICPSRVIPINPSQNKMRRKERVQGEILKTVGTINLEFIYHPPNDFFLGCLLVKIIDCKGLISTNHQTDVEKPRTYVCLETITLGVRHCFIKWGQRGNKFKPKKSEDNSGIECLTNLVRTQYVKDTRDPVFNSTFVIPVFPHSVYDPFFLDINIWESPKPGPSFISRDYHIGSVRIYEHDMKFHILTKKSLSIQGVLTENDFPKRIGQSLCDIGYYPEHPILLIPGFCSSGLYIEKGNEKWIRERIWLSLTKLTQETKAARSVKINNPLLSNKKNDLKKEEEDNDEKGIKMPWESEDETNYKNRWLAHMCLAEDCCSDPKGISLRVVEGIPGIAYLTPGRLTNALSYVFGPMIEDLEDIGYEEGKNLIAAAYDWRLPPHFSEFRDQYFSKLAKTVEEMVKENNGKGVVIVPHSMGNRTAQYFLNFAEAHYGREWLDKNVHCFLAVGAPFLGAPKSIRGLCSGERLGLEAFLSEDDGLNLARRIGTTAFLFPVGCNYYFDPTVHVDSSFIYLKKENSEEFEPKPCDFALKDAGSELQLNQFDDYYMKNVLFGGKHESAVRAIACPPVKKMICVYGYNLPTEVKYFYEKSKNGTYVLKSPKNKSYYPSFHISKGVCFETDNTPHHFPKKFTGTYEAKSGDGSVPYSSLVWPLFWEDELESLEIVEIYGAEHRELLANRILWSIILKNSCNRVEIKEDEKASDHYWKEHNLNSRTFCYACGEIIIGKYKVAVQCSRCEHFLHINCLEGFPKKSCFPKDNIKNKIKIKGKQKRKEFVQKLEERRSIFRDKHKQRIEEHKEKIDEVKEKIKDFFHGKKKD